MAMIPTSPSEYIKVKEHEAGDVLFEKCKWVGTRGPIATSKFKVDTLLILDDKNKCYGITAYGTLVDRLEPVGKHKWCKIVYAGTRVPKSGGDPYHIFDVFMDDGEDLDLDSLDI